MKVSNKIIFLIFASLVSLAHASADQAAALYEKYEYSLKHEDLNGAYEALNQRRRIDDKNLKYIYDESEFLLQYSNDQSYTQELIENGLNIAKDSADKYWIPRYLEILAGLLLQEGDTQKAYETGTEAYSYFAGESNNEELSDICQLLIGICTSLGKNDEALKYGLQALNIRRSVLGTNHIKTASTLTALSIAYLNQNDFKHAHEVLSEGEQIYTKLGIEDETLVNNQGVLAFAQQSFDDAYELFSKALDLTENKFGNKHSKLIGILKSLSVTAEKLNRYDEAVSYINEAFDIASSIYGSEHQICAQLLCEQGLLANQRKLYGTAMDKFSEALKIYDKLCGETSQPSQQTLISMYRCACDIVVANATKYIQTAKDFMSDKYFTLKHEDKDPLYLLAFGQWHMNNAACIFDYIPSVINDDVNILLSADKTSVQEIKSSDLSNFTVSIVRNKQIHDELLNLLK